MEHVYSLNEDTFMDLEDIENEIDEINSEDENIKVTHVYRGEKIVQTNSMFVSGGSIVDDITDSAYENGDEWSELYCDELQQKKHYESIEKLIVDYLDKNVEQPSFYLVENVKKISIEELKND